MNLPAYPVQVIRDHLDRHVVDVEHAITVYMEAHGVDEPTARNVLGEQVRSVLLAQEPLEPSEPDPAA